MGTQSSQPESAALLRRLPWLVGLRRWFGEELTNDEMAAFEAETAERDIRRLRAIAPLMVLLHVAHIFLLRVSDSDRATLSADVARWYGDLALTHAATLPLALLISVVAFRWSQSQLGRVLSPFAAAIYLMHGAIVTGIDQVTLGNITAFTGYSFGLAVIFGFPLRTGVGVYALGGATALVAIHHFSQDPTLRMSNSLGVATVVTMSLALNELFYAARKRDFRQRRVIARQRDQLAGLNADLARFNSDLERRVNEQVGEILKRAGSRSAQRPAPIADSRALE